MAPIPLLNLKRHYEALRREIDAAVQTCFEHQHWILGPEVGALERSLEKYFDVPHCIGASSGTEALVLALRALSLRDGGEEFFTKSDLIATTPFTFTATGDSILRAGATPLFVDIDPKTFNIDLDLLERRLDATPGIKGVIAVHLYGLALDLPRLADICRRRNIFLVEDVAQAFGARFGDRIAGTVGDTGCFSFFPSKNLGGMGDAGAVTCRDSGLAELIRMLLKHGGKDKYNVEHIGYNARIDTMQAAIIGAKLPVIDEWNKKRRSLAARYNEAFKDLAGLKLPVEPAGAYHVFHQYTVRVDPDMRSRFMAELKNRDVESMVYYPVPLHAMKLFEGRAIVPASLSYAEAATRAVVSLPMDPLLSDAECAQVIEAVKESIKDAGH